MVSLKSGSSRPPRSVSRGRRSTRGDVATLAEYSSSRRSSGRELRRKNPKQVADIPIVHVKANPARYRALRRVRGANGFHRGFEGQATGNSTPKPAGRKRKSDTLRKAGANQHSIQDTPDLNMALGVLQAAPKIKSPCPPGGNSEPGL